MHLSGFWLTHNNVRQVFKSFAEFTKVDFVVN